MTNLWESDDYNIVSIKVKTESLIIGDDGLVSTDPNLNPTPDNSQEVEANFIVYIQRLPTSAYPQTTEISFTRNQYVATSLPLGISNSDLLANILPIVNSSIVVMDSNFDGSDYVARDASGFSDKNF
jgi:hypothetical protein